jgi:hypothetical protein
MSKLRGKMDRLLDGRDGEEGTEGDPDLEARVRRRADAQQDIIYARPDRNPLGMHSPMWRGGGHDVMDHAGLGLGVRCSAPRVFYFKGNEALMNGGDVPIIPQARRAWTT